MTTQCLLIDADDTLWENNVYFERVIARFIAQLDHGTMSAVEIRERLNDIEREYIISHGYGVRSFAAALTCAYERLAEHPPDRRALDTISELALQIAHEPIQILPGVEDTLDYLERRHQLVLFTKGDLAEQTAKVERSNLRRFFREVFVVAEKNPSAYEHAVGELGASTEQSWMVGNSPKSDINPALAAGLGAVFVPHADTWMLEHEEIAATPGQRLLRIESFADLKRHF